MRVPLSFCFLEAANNALEKLGIVHFGSRVQSKCVNVNFMVHSSSCAGCSFSVDDQRGILLNGPVEETHSSPGGLRRAVGS